MRHAEAVEQVIQAVRSARDDLAAGNKATLDEVRLLLEKHDRLADAVAELADATRAILLASRPSAQGGRTGTGPVSPPGGT